MPTTAQLSDAMERYAAAASSKDADAYAALFTADAVQVDPYPTAAQRAATPSGPSSQSASTGASR